MRLYSLPSAPSDKVPKQLADKYENEAGRYWDLFYRRNANKFFKDRHYLDKEFPELLQGQLVVLEVGCGVGNTVYPLLDINPQLQVYACDFSPTAVQHVKSHPQYASGRVTVFVADITSQQLLQHVPGPCVDYCSMMFVLSAVAPEKMPQAVRNVASVLKAGSGSVLFRDYADGDLAQSRLEGSNDVKYIRDNFYVRGDGTCCYYYTQEGLSLLFAAEGFVCQSMVMHARVIENRKSGVKMPRRWIQAVFRYDPEVAKHQPCYHCRLQQEHQQWQQPQTAAYTQQPFQDHIQEPAAAVLRRELQQQFILQHQQQHQEGLTIACAGQVWRLPGTLMRSRSSSSSSHQDCSSGLEQLLQSAIQLAQGMASLVQQQQLHLLGRIVVLAPPWLALQLQSTAVASIGAATVAAAAVSNFAAELQAGAADVAAAFSETQNNGCNCNQQQPTQQQQAAFTTSDCRLLQQTFAPSATAVFISSRSSGNSMQGDQLLHGQGAAAALCALVAVWLGAKRVYVCLPGQGPYEAASAATLQLNESQVVCERVRCRMWATGDQRQAQMLLHELQSVKVDVVVCQHGHALSSSDGRARKTSHQ